MSDDDNEEKYLSGSDSDSDDSDDDIHTSVSVARRTLHLDNIDEYSKLAESFQTHVHGFEKNPHAAHALSVHYKTGEKLKDTVFQSARFDGVKQDPTNLVYLILSDKKRLDAPVVDTDGGNFVTFPNSVAGIHAAVIWAVPEIIAAFITSPVSNIGASSSFFIPSASILEIQSDISTTLANLTSSPKDLINKLATASYLLSTSFVTARSDYMESTSNWSFPEGVSASYLILHSIGTILDLFGIALDVEYESGLKTTIGSPMDEATTHYVHGVSLLLTNDLVYVIFVDVEEEKVLEDLSYSELVRQFDRNGRRIKDKQESICSMSRIREVWQSGTTVHRATTTLLRKIRDARM